MLPIIIAGPCSMESLSTMNTIAEHCNRICNDLGFEYVFKSSFDKANRSDVNSYRGPGLEQGLKWLELVKRNWSIRVTTDVHESFQVDAASKIIDIIQIPAMLARQTDLILAAAKTGRILNIKKGQSMDLVDVLNIINKVKSVSNSELIITERGSTFGYHDLVVDFRTLIQMKKLNIKTGFDATHTNQKPSFNGMSSGGSPEMIPFLTRAAASIGVDYIFIETHPDPNSALSDGACMLPLADFEKLLLQIRSLSKCLESF